MSAAAFGTTRDGRAVERLGIGSGPLRVHVLTYGAVLHDVRLAGYDFPLTLGSPDLAAYEGPMESFGSLMGPVVNRIRDARAVVAGVEHRFEANFEGRHTLHSGATGMQNQVWEAAEHTPDRVALTLVLPDGLGGFPGNRRVEVAYTVEGATLRMEVRATSDRPTLLSPANHSYWTLSPGAGFAGHVLEVAAETMLEMGPGLMPTGREVPVAGTGYDLRDGLVLTGDDRQFFDLNFCVAQAPGPLRDVARLHAPETGLTMVLATDMPGLQVFDCATIDATPHPSHHGAPYGAHAGLALEAQMWPGATTHRHFPPIEGTRFGQVVEWRFDG
ncbi:MAG: aldose epimerase family protein [Shimia sp.]